MAWYNNDANKDSNILWSRSRIYRNIDDLEFSSIKDMKKYTAISANICELLSKNGFHASEESDGIGYVKYAELGYINSGFVSSEYPKALYLNEPCSLSVAIGGEDFICINSLLPSLSLHETYKSAIEVECLIDSSFDFAYFEDIGYISPNIKYTGHGVSLSVALFLPAVSKLSEIKKIKKKAISQGYSFNPMTVYDKNAGDFFVLEYIPDIHTDIELAIRRMGDFIKYIISLEKEYENNVFGDNTAVLNKAWRSFGMMEYSSSISEEELLNLLSSIRLVHSIGCADMLPYPLDIGRINTLQTELMDTYIHSSLKESVITLKNCDRHRAKQLNECIKSFKIEKGSVS